MLKSINHWHTILRNSRNLKGTIYHCTLHAMIYRSIVFFAWVYFCCRFFHSNIVALMVSLRAHKVFFADLINFIVPSSFSLWLFSFNLFRLVVIFSIGLKLTFIIKITRFYSYLNVNSTHFDLNMVLFFFFLFHIFLW